MATLIGVSGKIASGKDYLTDKLVNELKRLGFTIDYTAFAAPLKQELNEIISMIRAFPEQDELTLSFSIARNLDINYDDALLIATNLRTEVLADETLNGYSRTVKIRESLQYLGTEIRRKQRPEYWTDLFLNFVNKSETDFIFVSDARFPNEMDTVVDNQGVALRLDIPEEVLAERRNKRDGIKYTEEQLNHVSETALDDYTKFDMMIGVQFNEREIVENILRKVERLQELPAKASRVLKAKIAEHSPSVSDKKDVYPEVNLPDGQYKVLSLFAGAGGLDLGFELAGLEAVHGKEKVDAAYKDKRVFDELRKDNLIHTVYVNDNFKDAVASYRLNFPETFVDERDIKKINSFPDADLLLGGFPCFPKGTGVATKTGYKNIEDIEKGDFVLTHEGRYREVTDTMTRNVNKSATLHAYGSLPLVSTVNHPYWVKETVDSEPKWVHAENIQPGWFVSHPISTFSTDEVTEKEAKFAYLAGVFAQCGTKTLNDEHKPSYLTPYNDEEFLALLAEIDAVCSKEGKNVIVHSEQLNKMMKLFGTTKWNKVIPEEVHQKPRAWQKAFLEGFLFHNSDQEVHSKNLAVGVARILRSLNPAQDVIVSSPKYSSWIVTVTDTTVAHHDDSYVWVPVERLQVRNEMGVLPVYDITVAEDESFVADGFVVHNCPGFSAAGLRMLDDPRNFLYLHFVRAVVDAQPKIFVAENVKGLLTHGQGEAFNQIVEDFAAAGYTIYYKLMKAIQHGVPQMRERLIIVGVRNDIEFEYQHPAATHGEGLLPYKTQRDAFYDLRDLNDEHYEGDFSSRYRSRRFKLDWDVPSKTILATGRHLPLHPDGVPQEKLEQDLWSLDAADRRFTVREAARIQTFPDWYDFVTTSRGTTNTVLEKQYRQIGNAVPVELGRVVAEPIVQFLKSL